MNKNKLHILLIEDHPHDIRMFRGMFRELEDTILLSHTDTIASGLEIIKNGKFDLLISNLVFSDSSAVNTIKILTEQIKHIPLIAIAETSDSKIIKEALSSGFQDYLIKEGLKPSLIMESINSSIHRFKSEISFKTILDNNPDAILIIDKKDIITYVNKAAEIMFNKKSGELMGSPFGFPIIEEEWSEIEIFGGKRKIIDGEMRVVETELISESVYIVSIRDITYKKKMQRELEEKEKYYRTILHKLHEDILIINRDYIISDVNNSVMQTTGLKREDIVGQFCYSILMNLDRPCSTSPDSCYLQKVFSDGKPRSWIRALRTSRGVNFYANILFSPIIDDNGMVTDVVEAIRDISDIMEVQKDLKRTSERLELSMNAGKIGYWELDYTNNSVYFSPRWKKQLGYNEDEISNSFEEWEKRLHPHDHDIMVPFLNDFIKGPDTDFEVEFRLLHKDGSYRWIDASAKKFIKENGSTILNGCHIDITNKKEAEIRQNIFVQILELINQFDDKDTTIRKILDLLKIFTGFDGVGIRLREGEDFPFYEPSGFTDEFIENYLRRDNTPEQDFDEKGNRDAPYICDKILTKQFDPTKPFFTEKGSFWTNSISEFLSETIEEERMGITLKRCISEAYETMALIPIESDSEIIGLIQFNDRGKNRLTPGLIEFFEDISSCIGIAFARNSSREKIRDSLKEKDVLLNEIHHRVKNNMQIISSILGLQKKYIVDERDNELIENCRNRIKSMSRIHEKLYQSSNLSEINFSRYIDLLGNDLKESYSYNEHNIQIINHSQNIYTNIDIAIPCGQILTELLSNSFKHAFNDMKTGTIEINFYQEDTKFILVLEDNGAGYPENFVFPGTTSLGLNLVNAFVEQLNGTLEISTTKFSGVKYKIIFPGAINETTQ